MRYSLITQIVLLCLSAIIFATVTKPMFATINALQDEKLVYTDAVDKAQQFNAKLQEQLSILASFRQDDVEKLDAFLPVQIDVPKVMRDLESIFERTNIALSSIASVDAISDSPEVTLDENGGEIVSSNSLHSTDFTVTFSGTYENLKEILALAEVNKTLLEVSAVSFGEVGEPSVASKSTTVVAGSSDADTKVFEFTVTFRVFGLKSPKALPESV